MEQQETLEGAAIEYSKMYFSENKKAELGFIAGAGWQAERMYSEEDIKPLVDFIKDCQSNWDCDSDAHKYNTVCRVCEAQKVLEQFKID